jgi:hypothetical protein
MYHGIYVDDKTDDIMHDDPKLVNEHEICSMGFMLMTKTLCMMS